jgi:hypothetical protein
MDENDLFECPIIPATSRFFQAHALFSYPTISLKYCQTGVGCAASRKAR